MARSFFDVAVQNGDSNEAFLELAQLLESLKENDSALEIYKRGLEYSLGNCRANLAIPASSAEKVSTAQYDQNQQLDTTQETQAPSLAYSNESK